MTYLALKCRPDVKREIDALRRRYGMTTINAIAALVSLWKSADESTRLAAILNRQPDTPGITANSEFPALPLTIKNPSQSPTTLVAGSPRTTTPKPRR